MAMEDYVKITHKTEYGGHINTRRGVEHRGDIERKVTVVTSPLRTISKEYFLNGMPLPQKEGKRTVCSQVGSLPFLQIKREVKEAADVCFIEQVDFPFHLFICEHPKMSLDNRGEVFNAKRVLLTQGVDGIHNYDTEIEDINSLPLFYGIDVHNANEYFGNETHRNIFPRLKYPKRNFDAFYDARTKRTPYLTPELLCKVLYDAMLVHPNINKTVFKYDKFGVEITLAEIMDSWKEGEECLDCGFDAFDKSVLSNIMQYIIAVKKKIVGSSQMIYDFPRLAVKFLVPSNNASEERKKFREAYNDTKKSLAEILVDEIRRAENSEKSVNPSWEASYFIDPDITNLDSKIKIIKEPIEDKELSDYLKK